MTSDAPRAVLWDLDGTLVDTADQHFAAWTDTFAPRGVALQRDAFLSTFGRRNVDVLRDMLGDDLRDEDVHAIGLAKEENYRARVTAAQLQTLPGVAHWLRHLRQDGWRQAIASSAPHANIAVILDSLSLRDAFDAIVGEEDVQRGKPDPQVFLAAAARLGVPPERCIVVEDAPAGAEAARRAGMRSIGVRTGHRHLDADLVIDSLADLPHDAFDRLLEGGSDPSSPTPPRGYPVPSERGEGSTTRRPNAPSPGSDV